MRWFALGLVSILALFLVIDKSEAWLQRRKHTRRQINGCPQKVCYNGGKRICLDEDEALCVCVGDFTGHDCKKRYNSKGCPPKPCYNGGKLICIGPFATCRCTNDFWGKNCQRAVQGYQPKSF